MTGTWRGALGARPQHANIVPRRWRVEDWLPGRRVVASAYAYDPGDDTLPMVAGSVADLPSKLRD